MSLLIGQNLSRQGKQNGMLGERTQGQRKVMWPPEIDAGTFPHKPVSRGDTQFNRNELN